MVISTQEPRINVKELLSVYINQKNTILNIYFPVID
jgi:hypothetical protein